jgi:cysteine synthase
MVELNKFSLWTGNYSGCFIPDCFTPIIEGLSKKISSFLWSDDFAGEVFQKMQDFYTPSISTLVLKDLKNVPPSLRVNIAPIDRNFYYYFNSVGQALLSQKIRAEKIISYSTKKEYAISLAVVCYKLGIKCKIVLDKNLSEDEVVINYLKYLGCEIDITTCKELFDLPAMYAFQEWLTHPEMFFVSEKANSGPYLFTQTNLKMHEYATSFLLRNLDGIFEKDDSVIFPVETGTIGASLFLYLNKMYPLKFFSVRKTSFVKRNVSFCGGTTIALASEGNTKVSDIIAPFIASLWDSKFVDDVQFSAPDVENGLRIASFLPLLVDLPSGGTLSKGIEILESSDSKSGTIFLWRL